MQLGALSEPATAPGLPFRTRLPHSPFRLSSQAIGVFIFSDMLSRATESSIELTVVDPDAFIAPWSRNPLLQAITLLVRLKGHSAWQPATNDDGTLVTFPFMSQV